MTESLFFCLICIKIKLKLWLEFKFREKPVDFAEKLRYYEATERKAGQTCPEKLSNKQVLRSLH